MFDRLPELAPGGVDVAVTSPPYWMLRSYLPKGHALKPLELGSEPTPAAFVDNLVRVFRLVRTALADHGTVWVNIGDTYAQNTIRHRRHLYAGQYDSGGFEPGSQSADEYIDNAASSAVGIGSGSLCLIPQRLAIALSDDGWLVRSVVVWHKPAPMPASLAGWRWAKCRVKVKGKENADWIADEKVTPPMAYNGQGALREGVKAAEWQDCPGCDKCRPHGGYVLRKGSWRPTSSWEPVLMLAKKPGYFADGDAVKQPSAAATVSRNAYSRIVPEGNKCFVPDAEAAGLSRAAAGLGGDHRGPQFAVKHDHETTADGANLRDVWTIAAEPLREKHYAAFPSELVLRCLRAGTSARGYCPACGVPWARVTETKPMVINRSGRAEAAGIRVMSSGTMESPAETKTLGWRPSCPHADLEPRPGVVLDPFMGSGRTGIVARQLGLDFVGCELNPEYCELSRRLLTGSSPLFNQIGE